MPETGSVVRRRGLFGHAGNLAGLYALQFVDQQLDLVFESIELTALGGYLVVELLYGVFRIGETGFQGFDAIVKLLTHGPSGPYLIVQISARPLELALTRWLLSRKATP